jgi:heme/copper-type cytochrome/quinol oxidase subunit 3
METRFLRIAYAVQFVVTMMAIFEVWGQVGGQGHIDMMPWYAKLLLTGALSLATVKATAAAVDRDRFWNKLTSAWLAAALLLITAMGLLTLYEHLHEPADEGDELAAPVHIS